MELTGENYADRSQQTFHGFIAIRLVEDLTPGWRRLTMTAASSSIAGDFRRELAEFVSVEVQGTYENFDPDITDRTPGRVVIAMPDFTADALAHALGYLGRFAELLDADRLGVGPGELAQALREAAAATGVPCGRGLD